jgi:hypothetical protein
LKLEQDGRALHDDSVRLVAPHERKLPLCP